MTEKGRKRERERFCAGDVIWTPEWAKREQSDYSRRAESKRANPKNIPGHVNSRRIHHAVYLVYLMVEAHQL
jgi:hypothetical protein